MASAKEEWISITNRSKTASLGSDHPGIKRFLKTFDGRLVEYPDFAEEVRLKNIPSLSKWMDEVGPKWVNDPSTLVFHVPLEILSGVRSLYFAQEVWMARPSLFEYFALEDRGFVRMWWDTEEGALPYTATR